MKNYIYVLDINGNPLMPTSRHSKVRKLLKEKKAKIVDYLPFTIQLLYEPKTTEVQPVMFPIDPGRTNIGAIAMALTGEVFAGAKVTTRNKDIPKLMEERKGHHNASRQGERKVRQRRAKKYKTTFKDGPVKERILPQCKEPIKLNYIKNTEAKFCNRKRPERWLTPTATQLLRTTLNIIKKFQKILPISHCVLEYNAFAFMELDNPNIANWQYSKGFLYKEEDLYTYISKQQEDKCIFCNEKIDHYHHIVPRSKNGSNTYKNIAGLCEKHHTLVHTDEEWVNKLKAKKEGIAKEYAGTSILNIIMPYLAIELQNIFGENFFMCDGYTTKAIREKYHLDKDHHIDAYCIGLSYLESLDIKDIKIERNIQYFQIKQFRRHNRQLIHRQTERTYKLNGEIVAKNRQKRIGQTSPSLREWYKDTKRKLGKKETKQLQSKLKVLKSTRSYRNPNSIMPGAIFFYKNKRHILSGISDKGRYFRALGQGTKNFKAKDCKIIKYNTGLVFI